MSKKGGGEAMVPTSSTTTTTQTAPWAGQQPYLTFGFQQARNLYDRGGPQYYPGPTVAPVAPETNQALDLLARRAQAGSPLDGAAQRADLATTNGDFLSAGNPYFQQMMGQVADAVRPQVASGFESAGRYGSGAYANALAGALANAAGNLAYSNYGDERRNMTQAMALAPTLANQDYANLQHLASVGDARQQLQQQQINGNIDRYNYEQNLPYNNLANYMRMVQGNYGSSATQTAESAVNPLAGTLGLGRGGFDPLGAIGSLAALLGF